MPRILYPINLEKLKTINEETCYWVGFIAADGCVFEYAGGNIGLTISLQQKDKKHLQKFQNYIDDSRPLYYSERSKSYTLTIKRKELVELLKSYGIFPKKSLTLQPPSWITDEKLVKAWIRGYIDGDGSLAITYPRPNYFALMCGIVGTKEVLEFIRPYADTTAKLYQKSGQNSLALTMQGNHKVMIFLDWLYDKANQYLDRKYETYLSMKKLYGSFYGEVDKINS